jgi:hypothetical protein
MNTHHQLVLVPPFYGDGDGTTPEMVQLDCDNSDCDTAMEGWANFTRTMCTTLTNNETGSPPNTVLAGSDNRSIAAVMPYHWANLNDGKGQRSLGGSQLPKARAAWEAFGKEVLAQQ